MHKNHFHQFSLFYNFKNAALKGLKGREVIIIYPLTRGCSTLRVCWTRLCGPLGKHTLPYRYTHYGSYSGHETLYGRN